MTINQLAFAIQTSIYKHGISPKNYLNQVIDATADVTGETVADQLSEDIANDVVDTIVNNNKYAKEK